MSLLADIRKRRRELKKQLKVAKAKAKVEAKEAAKRQRLADKEAAKRAAKERKHEQKLELKAAQAERKQEVAAAKKEQHLAEVAAKRERKLDARALKRAEKMRKANAKEEKKALAAKRKYQYKMADKILAQQKSQGFTKEKAKAWIGGGRLLVPVLVPLAYRIITGVQKRNQEVEAKKFGVSGAAVARHHGYGAPLRARVEATRESLDELGRSNRTGVDGFIRDARSRLDIIADALDTAENLTPDQRRRAHQSITAELDGLDRQILSELGV